MEHAAELPIELFLKDAVNGKASMSEEIIQRVASDVAAGLNKQFNSGPRDAFRLRMSNIGRPKCQLWFEKNNPVDKIPPPPHFIMNMLIGDIVEAVFKGILRASGVKFEDAAYVKLNLPDGTVIHGEYDLVLDGRVDDIKSASPYSYQNKFKDAETLRANDSFGYMSQLVGYATAADKKLGGWWVVNKQNGEFKYINAEQISMEEEMDKIVENVNYINQDEPFERCFEPVKETYYKKESGNTKLCMECTFCGHKKKCWPELKTQASLVSKAKTAGLVDYIHIKGD